MIYYPFYSEASWRECNKISSESMDKDMIQGQVIKHDWLNAPVTEKKEVV